MRWDRVKHLTVVREFRVSEFRYRVSRIFSIWRLEELSLNTFPPSSFLFLVLSFLPPSLLVRLSRARFRPTETIAGRGDARERKKRSHHPSVCAAKSRFSGSVLPKANARAKGVMVGMGLITQGGCNRKLRRVSVSSKAPWLRERLATSGDVPREHLLETR